jgi:hypothetical protein
MCLTSDGMPQDDPVCENARLDGDPDVDQVDVAIFLQCFGGANVLASSDCLQ